MTQRRVRANKPPDKILGSYVGHPRGFGFLVLEGGGDDLFVPPNNVGDGIDGDRVEAVRGDRGTARVVRVLARGRKLLVGTHLGHGQFAADAHRIPQALKVEGKARKGDKILVETTKTKLRVRRVLGRAGDPAVEDSAVLAELEIKPRFPKNVWSASQALKAPSARDTRGRLDLRKATTVVTIDPVTSRDFDDAISLERRGKDWLLGVHIADVSHYVLPDTPLDREAYRRGTSIYLPSRVIPMLPEKLSNDLCSLREGVDRLAMSVLMRYGSSGELKETTFAETVIQSDRRFSYERASRVMDRAVREKGEVGALLLDMVRLSKLLAGKRESLDFPRGELELVYGGQGEVVDLRPVSQDVAHGVIEEFMLAANREVARLLLRKRVASIYRHHPEPADLSRVWNDFRLLGIRRPESIGVGKAMAAAVSKGLGPAA
ncbi:MAG: RNB domain-containing ribonuclease, partial [Planctomycetota bacterium]